MAESLIHGSMFEGVEAAYDTEPSDAAWLAGIVDELAPKMDQGLGVFAWLYDAPSIDRIKVFHPMTLGIRDGALEHVLASASHPETSREIMELHYATPAGCGSEQIGQIYPNYAPWAAHLYPQGIRDVLTLNALDVDGKGLAITALMSEQGKLSDFEREHLQRVSAHLVSAYRLRRANQLASVLGTSNVEAILDTEGKVQHAEAQAEAAAKDGTLLSAASMIAKARNQLRHASPEQALEVWRALVAGRWSVVDFVDTDGKRFLVAKVNEPIVTTRRPLSTRERQIAGFVRRGHSNKMAAYTLGLTESTVATHVANVLQKLGLSSRVELAKLMIQEESEPEGLPA